MSIEGLENLIGKIVKIKPMVIRSETGDINMDSVGTTYGTGGVNVGYFKSKGTQISKMAREAAPPRKRNTNTDILGGIFLGFFLRSPLSAN